MPRDRKGLAPTGVEREAVAQAGRSVRPKMGFSTCSNPTLTRVWPKDMRDAQAMRVRKRLKKKSRGITVLQTTMIQNWTR